MRFYHKQEPIYSFKFREVFSSLNFLFFCLLLNVIFLNSATSQQADSKPQQNPPTNHNISKEALEYQRLGNASYNDGFYKQALDYYFDFKDEIKNNKSATLTAYKSIINSYIKLSDFKSAQEMIETLKTEIKDVNPLEVDILKASLYIAQKNYKQAREIYNNILKNSKPGSSFYIQALSGVGYCSAKLQDWNQAIKVYSELSDKTDSSKLSFTSFKHKFFAFISQNNIAAAKKLLEAPPKQWQKSKRGELEILPLFILIAEKKLNKAYEAYEKIDKLNQQELRPLIFNLSYQLGKAYINQKDYKTSESVLIDAWYLAVNSTERKHVLSLLIDLYILSKDFYKAITHSERYLKYYESTDKQTFLIKRNLARLFVEQKQTGKAIAIYNSMINSPQLPMSSRLEIAQEAYQLLSSVKLYQEAIKKLNFIYESASDQEQKAKSLYNIALLLFAEEKYYDSFKKYIQVGTEFPTFREKSLYQAIRILVNIEEYAKLLQYTDQFLTEFKITKDKKTLEDITYLHAYALLETGNSKKAQQEFIDFAKNYPKSSYTPKALIHAGKIACEFCKFSDADSFFTKIITNYPTSPETPEAIYQRMFVHYFEEKNDAAVKDALMLEKKHLNSPYTLKALFWLADFYHINKDYKNADNILATIFKHFQSDNNLAAKTFYERALVAYDSGEEENALLYLDELSAKYPDNPILSKALFLAGEIYSRKDNFLKALTFYKKAAERKPVGDFEIACFGRIGDCYIAIFPNDFNPKELESALNYFHKVLAHKSINNLIKSQTLFKIAKCNEMLGKKATAQKIYRELIYSFTKEEKFNTNTKEIKIWLTKAALALSKLYLAEGTPEAAQHAIKIYQILINSNIQPIEEFKYKIISIKKKYKI